MIQFEAVADHATMSDFESYLFENIVDGIEFREVLAADPVLRASDWEAVLVSISSAASLKTFKDAIIAFLASRRCSITLRSKDGVDIKFEGPSTDAEKVLRAFSELELAAAEPPKGS
jgi:hypothetical protein